MEKFISYSPSTKKILKVVQMSISLPVNVMIIGQNGVGKKLLSSIILPDSQSFVAQELEKLINTDTINLQQYKSIIIYNIHNVLNKYEFISNFKDIKIVATSLNPIKEYSDQFSVNIEIPSLDKRPEDLEVLTSKYIDEANKIYNSNIQKKDITINLNQNGISLKQSIYKSILLASISKDELIDTLEVFLKKELQKDKDYRDLLAIFEIPLLKASTTVYKTQLQMAAKLNINRITLRKKLTKYFGK
jgi:DNA-binding NtrC family response regulator